MPKFLQKLGILDAVNTTIKNGREEYDPARYRYLGAVIDNFGNDGKINHVCFLHDYLQAVSSDDWPRKEEILKLLSSHHLKIFWKTRWDARGRFYKWWWEETR